MTESTGKSILVCTVLPNTRETERRKDFILALLSNESGKEGGAGAIGMVTFLDAPAELPCIRRNLSTLTWSTTSEEGTAGSRLPGSHQEQQKVPIRGNQIIIYPKDRSKQNCDLLWIATAT